MVNYIQKSFSCIFCVFFSDLIQLMMTSLFLHVQPNIVSIEEGFAFNKLSSIYIFSFLEYSQLWLLALAEAILCWIVTPSLMTLNFLVWVVCNHYQSCGVTRANREPKSTSSQEPTSSQPRVKSIFFILSQKNYLKFKRKYGLRRRR